MYTHYLFQITAGWTSWWTGVWSFWSFSVCLSMHTVPQVSNLYQGEMSNSHSRIHKTSTKSHRTIQDNYTDDLYLYSYSPCMVRNLDFNYV